MANTNFSRWVTPLRRRSEEPTEVGGRVEYEDFPCTVDVTGPLLHTLFQERWQDVELGHVVQGSVLELSFTQPPKIFVLYDGYLTVVTEAWHLHLCVAANLGGPHDRTPESLRQQRLIKRAALYRRFNASDRSVSWGIQFWNGSDERMMTLFLPNPYIGEGDELLPEGTPQLEKLGLYETLRQIYVLGEQPIPYTENPLKRPYLAVCRSGRCNPSRNWQPTFDALQQAVDEAGLDVAVQTAGCLEVCKLGPVVFYSGDRTWYTRVTPEVAQQLVQQHVAEGQPLPAHRYPRVSHA
ncbi:MAG: (2Fe-2S) ferredoxin domain-containing protein [Leptolyngbya sp. SIO4C5]|nr:(2Fe-2S) ferredoxin domain-containing protein [Leptolyngbya sp. SIO4C5]